MTTQIKLIPLQVNKKVAADMLSISVRTLERLVERRELPKIGEGRLVRFAITDLEAWIERNRTWGGNA